MLGSSSSSTAVLRRLLIEKGALERAGVELGRGGGAIRLALEVILRR
jgi:hypothetical protein